MSVRELYRWVLLSKDGGPVTASNGISVAADMAMTGIYRQASTLRRPDMVLVCSGLWLKRFKDPEVFGWLRLVERQGSVVGALCTGASVLARAGLLNPYKCATPCENLSVFQAPFPEHAVCATIFALDPTRSPLPGGPPAPDMILDPTRH